MITQEVRYHAPATVAEALKLLADGGDDAEILAGGMSLVPTMTLGLAHPEALVSLKRLGELAFITVDDDEIRIGAMTTHTAISESSAVRAALPVVADCAALIGDVQVRNRGTIGGSLAHADPAANYPPLALALGASMVIQSAGGTRVVHADDFFRGVMETAVGPGGILTEVRIPRPGPGTGAAYAEFVRVEGNFALVNACAVISPDGTQGHVAVGGVVSTPQKIDLAPALGNGGGVGSSDGSTDGGGMSGGRIDQSLLDRAVDAVTANAYADINGTADYKRALARTFAFRAATEALATAGRVSADQQGADR